LSQSVCITHARAVAGSRVRSVREGMLGILPRGERAPGLIACAAAWLSAGCPVSRVLNCPRVERLVGLLLRCGCTFIFFGTLNFLGFGVRVLRGCRSLNSEGEHT